MLGETERGDLWRESLAANEALETELSSMEASGRSELKLVQEVSRPKQSSDSSRSLGVTKCLFQGPHGELVKSPL